jgi:hypothetical protein
MDKLSECPSEVITMILGHLQDLSDLENIMLACPHVWRCIEHDSYLLPILNELLTSGSVPVQVVFPILLATHISHRSPLVRTYVDKNGLNLLRPGRGDPGNELDVSSTLKSLPSDMTPPQIRSLLTTSSAIRTTALRCLATYAARFHAMQPYTTWVSFEQHEDESNIMPAMSRYSIPDTGPVRWTELQRALKAFWMVHTARVFLTAFEQGAFHDWSHWKIAEISRSRPIDLFNFPMHGSESWRKRPRDYLLTALHLYLGAEEYLQDIKVVPQTPLTQPLPPCPQRESESQDWPHVSETMEYFAKMFTQIRSQRDGDGFRPWRRLGFAIWDTERLERAGLINDIRKDTRPHVVHWLSISRTRDLDRIRWLSVVREEDMPIVRNHRLTVDDDDADGNPDFEYPEDSDESESMHFY